MTTLISRGHCFADIRGYTLAQMSLFYAAAIKARIEYMADIKAAVWADEKAFNKFLDSIARGRGVDRQ